jgi:hypothetical protein
MDSRASGAFSDLLMRHFPPLSTGEVKKPERWGRADFSSDALAESLWMIIGVSSISSNPIFTYHHAHQTAVPRPGVHVAYPGQSWRRRRPRPNVRLRSGRPISQHAGVRGLRRKVRRRASYIGDGSWLSLSSSSGWICTRIPARWCWPTRAGVAPMHRFLRFRRAAPILCRVSPRRRDLLRRGASHHAHRILSQNRSLFVGNCAKVMAVCLSYGL